MSTIPAFLPVGNIATPIPGLPDQADLDPRLSRTHYFDGRLLTAADLTRDQSYLDQRLREVGRALGHGVVRGLEAVLQSGRIVIEPGIAVTPAGRVLTVASPIRLNLNDRALIAGLNGGSHLRLPRGLYGLVLGYVEQGRGVAEVFPQDLDGRTVQYDTFSEGVQAGLVALPVPLPQASPLAVRAALIGMLAAGGLGAGPIAEEAVALGILAVRDDSPQWLDTSLLRHPLRTAPAPGDLQADLHRQYESLLADVLAWRRPLGGDFAAAEYFRVLPPTGRIPKAALDPVAGRQGFFPAHFRVWVAPIRQSDLELVQRESMGLPAIDLTREESVDLVVLAPLPNAGFGRLAGALERRPEPATGTARPRAEPVLMPHLDLLALRLYPVQPVHQLNTDGPAWGALWAQVGDTDPVFVRRPTRAAETTISGIRIAVGAPVQPDESDEGGVLPSPADSAGLVLDADALLLGRTGLPHLGALRPPPDAAGRAALEALEADAGEDAQVVLACLDLLILIERRFDPLIWPTLLAAARGGVIGALREGLIARRAEEPQAGTAATLVAMGAAAGLDGDLLAQWELLAADG